jgi:hypothetical protein
MESYGTYSYKKDKNMSKQGIKWRLSSNNI